MSKEDGDMSRVENSIVIERPVAEVWDFFMDWGNNEKWYGGMRVIQVTDGPPGLGTKIRMYPPLGPWKVPTPPVQIVEFEPHHLVAFNGTSERSRSWCQPVSFSRAWAPRPRAS